MIAVLTLFGFNKKYRHTNFIYRVVASTIRMGCSLFLVTLALPAISQSLRLKGQVRDAKAEQLPFATVLVLPDSALAQTDGQGYFIAKVSRGAKTIKITYTGYNILQTSLRLRTDTTITFKLVPRAGQLSEVSVKARRHSQQEMVQSTRTSTNTLTARDIQAIPTLGGEPDVIKTLQLLPGTVRGVEGSSDIFVRGGAADQNLVLLDGAPIYNTSHLFGFLSVFNSDILDKVESINGGFPAEYGGRLSSILDISTTSRIAPKTAVSGDIGLIASRLHIEQPLLKNKASFWLAGRRTYIDQVVKAIGEELPYFFYDLNGKVSFKPNITDQLDLSFYSGEDILDLFQDRNNDGSGFTSMYTSGNNSQALQWRRQLSGGWNSNLSLTRTVFKYDILNAFEENKLTAISNITDYGAKLSLEKDSLRYGARIKTGIEYIRHAISPNVINSAGNFSEIIGNSATNGKKAQELSAHVQQEWTLTNRVIVSTGLRGSLGLVRYRQYFNPEPRLALRYALGGDEALKLSYSRMTQYMHRISSSAASAPTDIWYPVTDSIRPQNAHQIAAAWQKYLTFHNLFFSVEGYYKSMRALIGYEEGTNLFFNTDFESKLIQGKGRAYGLEFLLRKETGKFTGWLSYSLAWSWRQYNQINNGHWFPARYDRRHNGALVAQYAFYKRWGASLVWEYISGSRFTPVIGQYVVAAPTLTGVDLIPIFSDINAVKLSDAHRLDLGLKFRSKPDQKFKWHWFVGVNNAYNRTNPVGIFIERDLTSNQSKYVQPGLFGLLPFISYGFKF